MTKKDEISTDLQKPVKFKKAKSLSQDELETIIGGPETSRGTKTNVP